MPDLLAGRLQMAISLGFHILFAVAGMAMPLLMVLAEWRWLRTGDETALVLAKKWARGTAILFAVGAVSGTVLSFELGLLWPRFMEYAGPLIGMPFSLEGFAFFLEAIALGVYLYGWEKVPKAVHLGSGMVVAASGLASGIFVVAVNAWMNTPSGFRVDANGNFVDVDLWRAFFNPAFPTQALHMAIAAYTSTAFIVLGIHARQLRKDPTSAFHRAAIEIVLPLAIIAAPLQAVSGDFSAKHIARDQPAKLAAAEALFHTESGVPLLIGGWPDTANETVHGAIPIPKMLSVLAKGAPDAIVTGLDAVPRTDWPPVPIVHVAFQIMVACGVAMIGLVLFAVVLRLRRREVHRAPLFLRAAEICGPLGLVALEAGWTVTEVGRQPWIISGVMRTRDAITPMPGLVVSLAVVCVLYAFLGVVVLVLLRKYVVLGPKAPKEGES